MNKKEKNILTPLSNENYSLDILTRRENLTRKEDFADSQNYTFDDLQSLYKDKSKEAGESTFHASREVVKQMTKKKEKNSLPEFDKKFDFHQKNRKNSIFSRLTQGLNVTPLASKVLLAITQEIYRQSIQFHSSRSGMSGIGEELARLQNERLNKKGQNNNSNEYVVKTECLGDKESAYSTIVLNLSQFTSLVNGGKRSSGSEIDDVKDVLHELDATYVPLEMSYGTWTRRIITIEGKYRDSRTNAEVYVLQVKPIFTREIQTDYVPLPWDILTRFRSTKSSKDIFMRLFFTLTEQRSYGYYKEGKPYSITKVELLKRIAIIPSYDKNPKRREKDFNESVEGMKKIDLIEKYKEEKGICYFYFSDSFTKEVKFLKKDDDKKNNDK